jgi:hypothetical protein
MELVVKINTNEIFISNFEGVRKFAWDPDLQFISPISQFQCESTIQLK